MQKLRPCVTPLGWQKAARWLLVVVLLDALTGTAKRLDLDSFVFLSNLTVEGRNGFLL